MSSNRRTLQTIHYVPGMTCDIPLEKKRRQCSTLSINPVLVSLYIRWGDRVTWLIRCAFVLRGTSTVTMIATTCDPDTLSPGRLRLSLRRLIPSRRLLFSLPLLPLTLFSLFPIIYARPANRSPLTLVLELSYAPTPPVCTTPLTDLAIAVISSTDSLLFGVPRKVMRTTVSVSSLFFSYLALRACAQSPLYFTFLFVCFAYFRA